MKENTIIENMEETQKATLAFRVLLAIFIFTASVGTYFTLLLSKSGEPLYFYMPNVQAFIIAVASLVAMLLARFKRTKPAMLLLLVVFSFSLIIIALFNGGIDVILGFLALLIYLSVASMFFSKDAMNNALAISFVLAGAIALVGFWDPFERIYYGSGTLTVIITIFLIVVYGVLLLRQYRTFSLRTKLVLAFIFLSAVGISIAFTFINANVRQVLTENSQQRLLAGSSSIASSVDAYLQANLDTISTAATYLDVRSYLLVSPSDRQGTRIERQVQNILYALSNRNPAILSYGILDLEGVNILDSRSKNIGQSESDQEYFNVPFSENKVYISSVLYIPDEDEASWFLSAPIYNDMGGLLGVLRVQYKASVLQDLVLRQENIAGEKAFSVLVDESHIILVHESNPAFRGKLLSPANTDELENLKASYLLPANIPNDQLVLGLSAVEDALNNIKITPYFSNVETALDLPVVGAITQLENTPWVAIAVQPEEVFLAPAQRQTQIALVTAVAVIALAAFSGFGLANLLAAPILRLQSVAQKFAEGDLSVKAQIETEDEIGELATTFNDLAKRLRRTIGTLEERVEERTKDLALHSAYLEGAAEVSQAAATFTDAEELSRRVVDLIRERFDLYYVGLFLSEGEWAVLHAGTGKAGETMLGNNHRLRVGEGMIGWAVKHGEARIALDVGEDAVRFENPVLPETRSEGALPLRSRGRVLGALTVQSREAAAFTVEIIATLQTMADQIAAAFDNAELLAKSETALEAERRAYGEFSIQSWQSLKQNKEIPAYRVNAQGNMEILDKEHFASEEDISDDNGLTTIIPLKSRGYVIGGIRITKKEESGKWSKEQLELIETISEQLSVALESARLFEETQRKAQRELIISNISEKFSATRKIENLMQIAVGDLRDVLGASDVILQLDERPPQGQ
ncbi:MAG: GAF domain-containing protein [Anaerolineae bacterium]|jgi:GAF domain-containing protein/HAMP domain-containing protein|nr:GAF domain-containing protein [Anaerolineae bacterium]MBT7192253.1 GAF domain-containing protein [Anaerolineae bacterium]MBT7990910.1 GAF domain-containing protein [Anaerolineae bacterium]